MTDLTVDGQTATVRSGRFDRLLDALERERCAAALLIGPLHVAHLTGYSRLYSGPLALLVLAGGETTVIAPQYELAPLRARTELDCYEGYGETGFGLELMASSRLAKACAALLPEGRIALASDLVGVGEAALALARRESIDFAKHIQAIRTIKDPDESERIARAYGLSLAAQSAVGLGARPDAREIDLYTAAHARAQAEAAAPIGFQGDLLVGDRSTLVCGPIGVPGPRRAQSGDVVVSDISVEHRGYWGDTARTFVVDANGEAEQVREFISGVLDDAAGEMRPGVTGAEIFSRMRRDIIGRYPDGPFPHHGGHGVGVTVWEPPHLVPAGTCHCARGWWSPSSQGSTSLVASACEWRTCTW